MLVLYGSAGAINGAKIAARTIRMRMQAQVIATGSRAKAPSDRHPIAAAMFFIYRCKL